jgi:hypothetical protein
MGLGNCDKLPKQPTPTQRKTKRVGPTQAQQRHGLAALYVCRTIQMKDCSRCESAGHGKPFKDFPGEHGQKNSIIHVYMIVLDYFK